MKKSELLAAMLILLAGKTYADDFRDTGAFTPENLAVLTESYAGELPTPGKEKSVKPAPGMDIRSATLKISGYAEKEFSGNILNAGELEDLTGQLVFLAGLPEKDIPAELLGYLEGISVSIRELLLKNPAGRDIGPAVEAALALESKAASIRQPQKGLRGNLNFAVGEVSLKLETLNFVPADIRASLVCKFEDGSGGLGSRPERELAVDASGGNGSYLVEISAGKLSHFPLFTTPKSCRYAFSVRSLSGASGDFTLAGSVFNMTREELKELLSDPELNKKISSQNQPLRLMERNGLIVKAK